MPSVKELAVRALETLISQKNTKATGWYLKPEDYEKTKKEIDDIVEDIPESRDTLTRMVEVALANDDADLLRALYELVGWDAFEDVLANDFGLAAFFVYGSAACMTAYLDTHIAEDPDTWVETCEERLFDELEYDFWQLEWAPSWREDTLAILYLLHFKGGISATTLLKKCIHHGFSSYYAPLCALGGRFEVDDLYNTNHTVENLHALLTGGLLETLKKSAATEDWVYLVNKLLE